MNDPELRSRLFRIASAPRKIHRDSRIILPEGPDTPIPEGELFGESTGRRILELGSGWGEFAIQWLESSPGDSFTAFEIKPERIQKMITNADRKGIGSGIRIVPVNFSWFLETILPANSFDMVIINFPDPWPKKRHWKHRIVCRHFPERITPLLKPGGELYFATDYGPYARKGLSIFRNHPEFQPVFPWPHYLRQHPDTFPGTRFESLHEELGRTSYYQSWRYTP